MPLERGMELRSISFQAQNSGRSACARLSLLLEQNAARSLLLSGTRLQLSKLSEATVRGDIEAVLRLVGSVTWTELNQVDIDGMTALHYAAKHDYKDIALLLLSNGASIDIVTRQGDPFQTAVKNRKEATAAMLLLRGASLTLLDAGGKNALHLAVLHRLNSIVMLLLDNYILDLNSQDSDMNTALHYATVNGDVIICRALLDYGAWIDVRNASNETVLHLAAGENNKGVLEMLLNLDFKEMYISKEDYINMERDDKKTALHLAAQMGHSEVMMHLIAHGANVHSTSIDKESSLHLAVTSGNENAVKLLLEGGARIDVMDKLNRTPLHNAVSHGHDHIVEILLSNGAELGCRDNQGNTPFLLAIKKANVSLTKRLVDEGADISDQDFNLKTGLQCAIENHNYALSFWLLDKFKALVYVKDKDGRTPFHYAAQFGYVKILKLLSARTLQLNETDNGMETALHLASRHGNTACVALLVNHPKAVTICNQYGQTALHLAVIHNQPVVCQMLLQGHADVNRGDSHGWPPLFYAIYHDDMEMLKMILAQSDTDVNVVDCFGNTCLSTASENGNAKAVHLLLESGAELRCVNTNGENFFDLAINLQHESVCKAILESSRWSEALSIKDDNGSHFMKKLITKYPHLVEIILNRSISFSDHHPEDPDFTVTFDFQFLDESPTSRPVLAETFDKILRKRKPLYYAPTIMLENERQQLLHHPIVTILMEIKWKKLCRYFYYLRFLVYLIYITLLNISVYDKAKGINAHNFKNSSIFPSHRFKHSSVSGSLNTMNIIILILNVLQSLNECFKLLILGYKYFYRPANYIEIALYISVYIKLTSTGVVERYEHAFIALCIFLAWTNLLFYLQGIPFYNIYVAMYLRVCATIIKLLILFGIILMCFLIIFGLLRIDNDQFKTIEMRILTLFTMMNGEVGLNDWWLGEAMKARVPFPVTTYGTMFLFLLFMIMAFTNLLIGLAVGDIESIRSSATMRTFKQKLRLIDTIQWITPSKILKKYVDERRHTYVVNRKTRLQRLIKCIQSNSIDDDLKQLRMNQDSFNYKLIQECYGAWLASNTVTGEYLNRESLDDNGINDNLLL